MRVVVDWDGTATEVDSLQLVLAEFGDERASSRCRTAIGRPLALHEAIALEVGTVRAPLPEVVAWVREHVRLRKGFREFVREHRPLVVSSGFHELIEPILERDDIDVEVRANRLDPRPEGWRARFRSAKACAVCGEPCKRADVAGLRSFAFVGDGRSDRCVSLLADRVFARAGLASYLDERRIPYERFVDFGDVSRALAAVAP